MNGGSGVDQTARDAANAAQAAANFAESTADRAAGKADANHLAYRRIG